MNEHVRSIVPRLMRKKVWIGLWILALALGMVLAVTKLSFHQLAAPHYLWGLLLIPPTALYLHHTKQRQQERLDRLYDSHLHPRLLTQRPKSPLLQHLGWLVLASCILIALARPQGPLVFAEGSTTGIDILVGIDVSDSMKALDEGYPNRMGAAASVVQQLTPALTGDRVGLFVFSGEAFSLAPFTYDHSTLYSFAAEVSPELLPSATTDLEEALKHALHRFQITDTPASNTTGSPPAQGGKLLLLFSDGENQLGDYRDELETLARHQIPVITIGVGSEEGARIPMDSLMGRSYKVWQGEYAITKLDAKALQTIASETQGSYLPLKKINQLPGLLQSMRQNLHSQSHDTQTQQFEERYPYWLLLGLLVWGLWPALFKPQQRKSKPPVFERFTTVLQRTLKKQPQPLVMAVLLGLLSPFLQSAWSWNPLGWQPFWRNNQGQEAYQAENYEQAEEAFQKGLEKDPDNTALRNNEAHAQYQNQRYDEAIENYKQNLDNPQLTPEQQANSFYNLGNSYYRKGQANPQEQQNQWKEALKAYQEALKRNPKDEQALENLNFVQQQLNQQQQQQNQGQNAPQNPPQQNPQQPPASGDQPDNQPSNNPQNQGNSQQDPGRAPDAMPTPEPSPQYFDQEKVDQFLKQQEQQEEQSKGGFRRTRQNPQGNPKDKGDPWSNTVKDW